MSSKSPDDLLLIREIVDEFHIGRATIRALVKSGELRHLKVGVKVLIPRWIMLEWVRKNLSPPPDPPPRV